MYKLGNECSIKIRQQNHNCACKGTAFCAYVQNKMKIVGLYLLYDTDLIRNWVDILY